MDSNTVPCIRIGLQLTSPLQKGTGLGGILGQTSTWGGKLCGNFLSILRWRNLSFGCELMCSCVLSASYFWQPPVPRGGCRGNFAFSNITASVFVSQTWLLQLSIIVTLSPLTCMTLSPGWWYHQWYCGTWWSDLCNGMTSKMVSSGMVMSL